MTPDRSQHEAVSRGARADAYNADSRRAKPPAAQSNRIAEPVGEYAHQTLRDLPRSPLTFRPCSLVICASFARHQKQSDLGRPAWQRPMAILRCYQRIGHRLAEVSLYVEMTKFNQCPNCRKKPDGGFFGGAYMTIHECKKCGTLYCYKCGDSRCPDCGSKERREVGRCYAK